MLELKAALMEDGVGIRHLFCFAQTDSTNTRAHELARAGYPEGTMVLADSQSAGRGQFNRVWHSPAGKGIYLSLILRPKASPALMHGITLMTAVCLAETFREACSLEVCIKWPNDILARGRKLSGILTEMVTTGDALDYVIVGVGINLTHAEQDFPEEIRCSATSVFMETGSCQGGVSLIRTFLQRFDAAYRAFLRSGIESVISKWCDLSGMVGRHVRVETAGTSLSGTVSGVDEDGFLVVRCADGSERRVLSGDVTLQERP